MAQFPPEYITTLRRHMEELTDKTQFYHLMHRFDRELRSLAHYHPGSRSDSPPRVSAAASQETEVDYTQPIYNRYSAK